MHEIVTLQLGQRSNYLATHFWNAQESYFTYSETDEPIVDHDIHFRAGLGADGAETYTPRTVIYDLKGGFGTLRKYNALYDLQDDASSASNLWNGTTTRQQEPMIERSDYQRNLDLGLPTRQLRASDVRYWSDFNRVFYHPRSIVQLNEYELNSQLMPFEKWSSGEEMFDSLDKEFDLLDRDIRPFVEECDQMQGFQLFTESDNAWGGFTAKYLDNLRDEYGKTSIWTWGIEDRSRATREKALLRTANAARSLQSIGQHASAYIRLASPPAAVPNYVNLGDGHSDWLKMALLCASVESVTLPTRFSAGARKRGTLSIVVDTLNTSDTQNLFELQASVPSAARANNGGINGHGEERNRRHETQADSAAKPAHFDLNYTPTVDTPPTIRASHVFAQVEVERDHLESESRPLSMSPEERLRRRLNEETVVEIYQTYLQFPLLDTFPDTLFESSRRPQRGLNVSAALVCTSEMKGRLLDLRNTTYRLMPLDEREALYNELTQMSQHYHIGYDSGSDSGIDDD